MGFSLLNRCYSLKWCHYYQTTPSVPIRAYGYLGFVSSYLFQPLIMEQKNLSVLEYCSTFKPLHNLALVLGSCPVLSMFPMPRALFISLLIEQIALSYDTHVHAIYLNG